MAGRRFDDGSLEWDDLHAFIFAAPPGSAVFHAVELGWGTTDHLLAHVIDTLAVANWQRTEDATKKQPRHAPKRYTRPGEEPDNSSGTSSVGGAPATVTTVGNFMAVRAERERRWLRRHKKQR